MGKVASRFLALMVLISLKTTSKNKVANLPQATPNTQALQDKSIPSPLPDPTKDWEVISKKDFSLKIPPGAKIIYKENIQKASNSAWLQVILDPEKDATQNGLV